MENKNRVKSQRMLENQKSRGLTPVMICTCLALVIRSTSGKSRKHDKNRLKPGNENLEKSGKYWRENLNYAYLW